MRAVLGMLALRLDATTSLADVAGGVHARPPAWRSLQTTAGPPAHGGTPERFRGAPPCLAGLPKTGRGQEARWLLGSYRVSAAAAAAAGEAGGARRPPPDDFDVYVQFLR